MTRIVTIFLVALAAAILMYFGVQLTARIRRPTAVAAVSLGVIALYCVYLMAGKHDLIISNIVVVITSILVGSGLGLLLGSKPAFLSFCAVASIADIISTTTGPTKTISQAYHKSGSELMLLLSISFQMENRIQQIIGIGDLTILAAIFYSLHRLGYRATTALVAPLLGLLTALVIGLFTGGVFGIPFIAMGGIFCIWFQEKRTQAPKLPTN